MQEKWLKVHFQSCFLAYGLHRATVVSGVKKLLNGDSIASACHNLMIGVKRVPHFHSNHDLLLPKSAIIVTTFLSSLQTKILNLLKVFIDLKDTTFIDCFVLATNLLSIFFYNCEPPPVEPTHPAIADEVSCCVDCKMFLLQILNKTDREDIIVPMKVSLHHRPMSLQFVLHELG